MIMTISVMGHVSSTYICKEIWSTALHSLLYCLFYVYSQSLNNKDRALLGQAAVTNFIRKIISQDEFIRLLQRCQSLHMRLNFHKG